MNNHTDIKPVRLAWIGALAGILYIGAGAGLAAASGALAFGPAVLSSAVLTLLALLTAGKFHFARRESAEKENLEQFRREHPGTELFDESDEALRLASRAHKTYHRFMIPAGGFLAGSLTLTVSVWLWRRWSAAVSHGAVSDPLQFAVLSLALFVAAMVAGAYYVGASRDSGQRWLRPTGAWLLSTGFLYLLAGVSLLFQLWNVKIANLQLNTARLQLAWLIVLGAELILSTIIEFYRPRTATEERPVYESRILSLFTEPGGIARNVAAALDYQFGFEVSEARFYRFFERTLIPFAGLMVVLFWLMTCLVVIRPEENGIRERLGRVVSKKPLAAGLYVKMPWPFAHIVRFPVERVQEITVGYTPAEDDNGKVSGQVIVWDQQHNKTETTYIVPNPHLQKQKDYVQVEDVGKVPVTTSFMAASIPLYYKVRNLYDYRYRHGDADTLIEQVAMREIVKYLAGVDIFDILTRERGQGGINLKQRIQTAVDRLELGIDIVFVGLEGLHPPVEVGDSFHKVVAASEQVQTKLLEAEQYAIRREPESEAEALDIKTRAETYRYEKASIAKAEIQRFNKQLEAYRKQPDVFVARSFLDVLEEETKGVRKYILASGKGREVIILDLKQKLRKDLLDLDLGAEEPTREETD